MRGWVLALAVAGCGPAAVPTREPTPEDERAAEARIKEQAAVEAQARAKAKGQKDDPANKD